MRKHHSLLCSQLGCLFAFGLLVLVTLNAVAAFSAPQAADTTAAHKAQIAQDYGKLPLSFEANVGQTDKSAKFFSRGSGYGLFLTGQEAVLALRKPSLRNHTVKDRAASSTAVIDVVRMRLAGANTQAEPTGADPLPGTANYFIGNDPAEWHSNVPTYAKVKYADVYPGVDLVYYGNQGQLEYDFVVAPGSSPGPIRLQFSGTKRIRLDHDGNLSLTATDGSLTFHKPIVYQERNGQREPVSGRFALLSGHTVGFSLGSYDHSMPLIIDPVMVYSTYLGGSGTGEVGVITGDKAYAIAVDSAGNAYISGSTLSADFPITSDAFQTSLTATPGYGSPLNVFVTKLNAAGTALIYSTYLGGDGGLGSGSSSYGGFPPFDVGGDFGYSLAIDSSGNAYITGQTNSNNFPVTTGAFQTTQPLAGSDAFVTKLNPTGSALVYSTYLGGSGFCGNSADAIGVDASGNAYVAGETSCDDFPVTSEALQTIFTPLYNSSIDAFVTKLSKDGSALAYSTYLGGSSAYAVVSVLGLALDSSDDVYIAGYAASTEFPVTAGAYQTTNHSTKTQGSNAFVTALNPTGTALIYSTYLGGSSGDYANAIAVDSSGYAYVTGNAVSTDFPVTPGAFQTTGGSNSWENYSGFLTKLSLDGSALVYSTYLGGNTTGQGNAIAVDSSGDAYVVGKTGASSVNPVTPGAFQTAAGNSGVNAFATEMNPSGSALIYSTYLAGNGGYFGGGDYANGVALDSSGNVYIAGVTNSPNFPVTMGSFETVNKAYAASEAGTAFVTKLDMSAANQVSTTTTLTSSLNPAAAGASVTFTASIVDSLGRTSTCGELTFTVDGETAETVEENDAPVTYITGSLTAGTHTIAASFNDTNLPDGECGNYDNYFAPSSSANLTQTITGESAAATPVFTPAAGSYTSAQSVSISDATAGASIYYTTNGTAPTTASARYTAAIAVSVTETLEAIAAASGYTNSGVASAAYTITKTAAAPTFSPVGGTYTAVQTVTISDGTVGASIYYTTNGVAPSTASTKYAAAIAVSSTETLEAIATASGYTNSGVASAAYTITKTAAAPTFSPVGGTYTAVQTVTISDATVGASIYYTTNGSAPTTASAKYTAAIAVSSTETLKAIAAASGYTNSGVVSAAYSITLATAIPAFSPVAGTYTAKQTVTISDTTGGAAIYYTTNGTAPSTASTKYSTAITVSASETLEAIATDAGHANSAVATAKYTITPTVATPTFSPAAGTYNATEAVTISDATAGATIYYTTNGTAPTTASTKYTAAISASTTKTLEAMAVLTGDANSSVATAAYTITHVVATPVFSVAAGSYASAQTVSITDATAGATIYYTTNKTAPTTASTKYTAAIKVGETETIEALATAAGYTNSAVVSQTYTIR
jgi:hypothetical protein